MALGKGNFGVESEQGFGALRPDGGSGEGCGLACRPEGRQGSQEAQAEGAHTAGEGTQAGIAREHVQGRDGRNRAPPPVFVQHGHSVSVWGGLTNLWWPWRGHSRAGSVAKAKVTGKVRTKGGRGSRDPTRDLEGKRRGMQEPRHPPPHGHVDDDQHKQGERGHATAHDERHGRQSRLLHVLRGAGRDRGE